jgi:hypothetical protein
MAGRSDGNAGAGGTGSSGSVDLVPREFLRTIAVWSLVPSYLLAGAFLGYLADRFLGWFPYVTGLGLLAALALAVRDMYRLRDEL